VEAVSVPDALLPDRTDAPVDPTDPTDPTDPSSQRDTAAPRIRTVPALRDRLRAALLLLDPEGQADRATSERQARKVVCRATSDVMGELIAQLPLEHLAVIAARMDHAVQHARRQRDSRTADQVRADTLVDLLTEGLIPAPHPQEQPTTATRPDTGAATPSHQPDTPGPAPTSAAPSPTPEPPGTQASPAAGGQTSSDQAFGHQASGSGTSDGERPGGEASGGQSSSGEESGSEGSGAFGSAGNAPPAGRPPCHCGFPQPLVIITIGLATLLGLRDDPGYLDRYGPIAADLARDLAEHGTWRCAALDPAHGTLLGLGRPTHGNRYVPSLRLQQLTNATYRHCTFPGCITRAAVCDLDHAVPYPAGATRSCNLHPACRRHHRMKTTGHLRAAVSTDPAHPPGTIIWTTPTDRS
jgi:hypothetical protein